MSTYFFAGTDPVGVALADLALTEGETVRVNHDPLFVSAVSPASSRRVAIVSGGGSGHEPLHAGFVGAGMLDAAVPGQIFASPHNRQVYEASRAVAREGGGAACGQELHRRRHQLPDRGGAPRG